MNNIGQKIHFLIKTLFLFTCLSLCLFFLKVEISIASEEKFLYDSTNIRDPFVPLVVKDKQVKRLEPDFSWKEIKLEGIIIDPEKGSYIMVDDEIFKTGDKIGPYEVSQINESFVIVTFDGQNFRLQFEE